MTGRKQVALVSVLLLSVLLGKVFYESRSEWMKANREIKAGQMEEAVHHLGRTIHWYFPGNPYTEKACKQLFHLGGKVEAENPRLALLAYDSLRGSLHAIRSFYWPYKEWIPKANFRIAELRAKEQVHNEPGLGFEKALAFHQNVLIVDERPRIAWVWVVEIGFLGWILSVLGWIWKGFTPEGAMLFRRSIPWMASVVLFFALWIVGLMRA